VSKVERECFAWGEWRQLGSVANLSAEEREHLDRLVDSFLRQAFQLAYVVREDYWSRVAF
jgi:hypothetical protein